MVLYFGKAKLRIVDAVKIIPVSIDILTKTRAKSNNKKYKNAAVVKLADAPDSKSGGLILRVGSSPTSGTKKMKVANAAFIFCIAAVRTRSEGSGEALRSESGAATDQRHQV